MREDIAEDLKRELQGIRTQQSNPTAVDLSNGEEGTGGELGASLAHLQLSEEHLRDVAATVAGGVRNIRGIYPLSPLQEGMLFHRLLNEASDTYILSTLFELANAQSLKALAVATQKVIARHDALRSAVIWEKLPRPVLAVCRRAQLPIEHLPQMTLDQFRAYMRPVGQALNLRQAPLMRLLITEDPAGGAYALLQVHHLICDHTSLNTIVAEIATILDGREADLSTPVSYGEYMRGLEDVRLQDAEEIFRRKFRDVSEKTAPFGLLDTHGDGSCVAEVSTTLAVDLGDEIRNEARRLAVSPARLFHAAWARVAAGTSERDDVVFGTVLAAKHKDPYAPRALGLWVNTLPLRLKMAGASVQELVEQTNRELSQLITLAQVPLTVAQQCSGLPTSESMFTSLLNYRHNEHGAWAMSAGIAGVRVLARGEAWTNYPISVTVDNIENRFVLIVKSDRRIDPRHITQYLETAIRSLVRGLRKGPQLPSMALPILPSSEYHRILESFNRTQVYPCARLVHEVFEDQVRRSPEAIAVLFESTSLTFYELNARSNQLARHLRAKGAGADEPIGICVERGFELLVGLLGILKAGCAYVPLDPSYPAKRLQDILEDALPSLVVTQKAVEHCLPNVTAQVVLIDQDWPEIAQQAPRNLDSAEVGAPPSSLAYVIYTSGSTGRPKGVMVEHRSVISLWQGLEEIYQTLDRCTRVGMKASFNFDASVKQLVQLLSGRAVVIVPQNVRLNASMMGAYAKQLQVDCIDCTPSQLRTWLSAGLFEGPGHPLQTVLVGGEEIDAELWEMLGRSKKTRFYNLYGPTEATVDTSWARVAVGSEPHIGQPMRYRNVYILDRYRQPVPIGAAGEIFIGGVGVARGYMNRPAFTAERFGPDPFGTDPGSRLYRTGDLGRWRVDGTIEYLGRNDDQVKIRGLRIELGEIEAQLARHDAVAHCVVVVREDTRGQKRLIAYVVLSDQAQRPASSIGETLRDYLKLSLPEYMVPSAFVALATMPLSASGKIDRLALPPPGLESYVRQSYESPRGSVELTLARIWQDLLGIEHVGRRDSFFDLGGHSLLVLTMLFRMSELLDVSVTVADVYRNATLERLARHIMGERAEESIVDLSIEATLEAEVVALPGRAHVPANTLLLTGATGFVGRFLLAELLRTTRSNVVCLVRSADSQAALRRLRETMLKWDLWPHEADTRVRAVAGDLRRPRLGLDDARYHELCETVDCIYHCATSMNHLETYAMAKPANVDAARELLRIATQSRPKLINYISTMSVFSTYTQDAARSVHEGTSIDSEVHRSSEGYAASKWVGERIFMLGHERGIPCNIFRVGLVWADSERGRYDELQRVYRIIKSSLIAGYGIKDFRTEMTPTAVDYVARAIVALADQNGQGGQIFHVASSVRAVEGIFERCNVLLGTKLKLLTLYDWILEIRRLHNAGESLPVVPLVEFAFSMDKESFEQSQRSSRAGKVTIDCTRTHRELERQGIVAPVFDDYLLRAGLQGMLMTDDDLRRGVERAAQVRA